MAKSRRTEKQQLLKDYEALLQEEERLRREEEEEEACLQQLEYDRYLYEQEMEEIERRTFEEDWLDDDPWPYYDPWPDYNW